MLPVLLLALPLLSTAFAQAVSSSAGTATCVKRSALLYTSGSVTFSLSDIASPSATAPSSCPTITVSAPTTVYTCNASSTQAVLANDGFEAGNVIPFSTSSTSNGVSARIAEGGPVAPASGSSYLLITYSGSSTTRRFRRQSPGTSYVLTQTVSTISGISYTISAEALEAGNSPDCYVQICANNACGSVTDLTTAYQLYAYSFIPSSGISATISLTFTCQGAGYVGVDNVRVPTNSSSSAVSAGPTPYATTTIFRTRTTSIVQNGTASAPATRTVTVLSQQLMSSCSSASVITVTMAGNASQPMRCPTVPSALTVTETTAVSNDASTDIVYRTSYITSVVTSLQQGPNMTQTLASTVTVTRQHRAATVERTVTMFLPQETQTLEETIRETAAQATATLVETVTHTPYAQKETTVQSPSIVVETVTQTPYAQTETTVEPASTLVETVTQTPYAQTETDVYTSYETDTTIATTTEINTATETTVQTTTATATKLCDSHPLQGGAFYDLSDWTYDVAYGAGSSYNIETSGGNPGFYLQDTCDAAASGGDNWQQITQHVNICQHLQYNYTFQYQFQGDTSINSDCSMTLWIQGTPISGVYGTFPLDSIGNPSGNSQNVGNWYTYSGSWDSSYFFQGYDDIDVAVRFHCGSANVMTFGLDSFTWVGSI